MMSAFGRESPAGGRRRSGFNAGSQDNSLCSTAIAPLPSGTQVARLAPAGRSLYDLPGDAMPLSSSKFAARVIAFAPLLGVIPAATRAQVQTHVLTRPEVEYPESFTRIRGVRELGDGRVLVLDFRERSVQLIDLQSGRATRVGRTGKGPGEYSLPVGLIPLGGGSFGIVDEATRRILVVLRDGKTGRTFRPEPPAAVDGDDWEALLHEADERGRLYAQGPLWRTVKGIVGPNDSVPVVRWTPGQPGSDTLTWVRIQGTSAGGSMRGKAHVISIGVDPFVARDQWAVAADGRIAVADPDNYRILFTDPTGRRTAGPPIPFTPLEFTEAHKQEWRAQQRGGVAIVGGDDGNVSMRPVRPGRNEPEPKWPDYLPPFLGGALKFAPDGRLWVRRSGAAGAALTYDVIDHQGRAVQRVELPKHTQLIGFGANGAIYTVRTDDDDLEYLQRYRIP
jgi:hypothetical protein